MYALCARGLGRRPVPGELVVLRRRFGDEQQRLHRVGAPVLSDRADQRLIHRFGIVAAAIRLLARKRALHTPDIAVEGRSEEHTSELQSLMRISYAVFCLKKKK